MTIPHKEQKYPTAGDYYYDNAKIQVRISELAVKDYEMAIAIHELVEIQWCLNNHVPLEASTEFDLVFEKERSDGKHGEWAEPGDDPRCPYYEGHQLATKVELSFIETIAHGNPNAWQLYCDSVFMLDKDET